MKKAFTILILILCEFQINPNFGIVIVKKPGFHAPTPEIHLPGIYDFFISNNLRFYAKKMNAQINSYHDDLEDKNSTFAEGKNKIGNRILPALINYLVIE